MQWCSAMYSPYVLLMPTWLSLPDLAIRGPPYCIMYPYWVLLSVGSSSLLASTKAISVSCTSPKMIPVAWCCLMHCSICKTVFYATSVGVVLQSWEQSQAHTNKTWRTTQRRLPTRRWYPRAMLRFTSPSSSVSLLVRVRFSGNGTLYFLLPITCSRPCDNMLTRSSMKAVMARWTFQISGLLRSKVRLTPNMTSLSTTSTCISLCITLWISWGISSEVP